MKTFDLIQKAIENPQGLGESLKKFQFFTSENIQDKPLGQDPQAPTLNDIDISEACCIGNRLFFSSQRKLMVYVYEGTSIQGYFPVYTEQLHLMRANKEQKDGLLFTFGVDADNQLKSSYVKIWDPSVTNYQLNKPKRQILIGKSGQPLKDFTCFTVSKDLTAMAFGMQNGTVMYYKSKNLLNLDFQETSIQADPEPIRMVLFSRVEMNLNLYVTTDSSCLCYPNMQNRKRLGVAGGTLYDLTAKGTLIGSPKEENQQLVELDDSRRIQTWNFEGEKLELCFFKNHYLIMLLAPKLNESREAQSIADTATQLVVFDVLNLYVAYQEKFQKIKRFIPAGDFIYLITLNQKGEKLLIKLSEKENTYKIETFFKKNFFDVMYRFAANQSNDKSLLAEISRLHGDNLYSKHDFQGAIQQYINTAGYLEPSYVIGKFLDVSHVDYLIQYLAALHKEKVGDKKIADQNHTALLLNCYVKQKQIEKLEEFLKESTFESDLFDIETAIRECRARGKIDLAMRLAESKGQDELYLKILIEDQKPPDYPKAIEHIRFNIKLDEKVKYLKEFGQELMKHKPEQTLEVIENLVLLNGIAINIRKKNNPNKEQELKQLPPDDLAVYQFFRLSDRVIEDLLKTTFPKPDEFLHLFVTNNEQLENYLLFLIKKCKNLQNEKTIYHRFFEFYLDQYQQYVLKNSEVNQLRKDKDLELSKREQVIMDLLDDQSQENEKKYDKNHLLVLFKMYKFEPGIVFMLKKLQMREELLNFYISVKDNDKIIQLCRENGEKETNLWIQALKYFAKAENKSEDRIQEILQYIANIQVLSPLLILNILSQNRNVNFKLVKSYFINKIKEDKKLIDDENRQVKEKMKKAADTRAEYKKLKTQAKVFQATRCATCENSLTLPSLHFLCGHSYHENCLNSDKYPKDCVKCSFDSQRLLERKQQFDAAISDVESFMSKLKQSRDKFDVICEYLGRGIIKNNAETNEAEEDQLIQQK